jgi:hypothetical protein
LVKNSQKNLVETKMENKINWKNRIHWRANKIKSYTTNCVLYFCLICINNGDYEKVQKTGSINLSISILVLETGKQMFFAF